MHFNYVGIVSEHEIGVPHMKIFYGLSVYDIDIEYSIKPGNTQSL